jgi:hypothetical protein
MGHGKVGVPTLGSPGRSRLVCDPALSLVDAIPSA